MPGSSAQIAVNVPTVPSENVGQVTPGIHVAMEVTRLCHLSSLHVNRVLGQRGSVHTLYWQ